MDYSNFNEIWGIKPKPIERNNKIENFTSNKKGCENFNHILSCEKCLKNISEKINNKQLLDKIDRLENYINRLKNRDVTEHFLTENIINIVKNLYNKHKIYFQVILILIFLLLSFLLVKPNNNTTLSKLQKHFIMVPRDMFTFSNLQ
jgi:hypothetical protein